MAETTHATSETRLPRVTIQFCTQCKWMLRAAYYAQELLSTFSLSLGEVALQPATGGVFLVEITTTTTTTATTNTADDNGTAPVPDNKHVTLKKVILWDRKIDGGFPETKELKRRVRDVIQPGRDLGHVDRDHRKEQGKSVSVGDGGVGEAGTGTGPGAGTVVGAMTVIGEEARKKTEEAEEKIEALRKKGEEGGRGGKDWEGKITKTTCSDEGGERCEDCE